MRGLRPNWALFSRMHCPGYAACGDEGCGALTQGCGALTLTLCDASTPAGVLRTLSSRLAERQGRAAAGPEGSGGGAPAATLLCIIEDISSSPAAPSPPPLDPWKRAIRARAARRE